MENKKMKNLKKTVLCMVMVTVVVMGLSGCGSKTRIDVTEGVEVVFSGEDGYGEATLSGTSEWAEEACLVLYDKCDDLKKLVEYDLWLSTVSVDFELDQTEGLSNGDTVTVTVSIDDTELSGVPITLTGETFEVTVEGLT